MDLRFGEFLVKKGLIAEGDVLRALETQLRSRIPLGQLALQRGWITPAQLLSVLLAQKTAAPPPKLFGQTAVELGMLSQAQVDEILKIQNESHTLIGNVLVSRGLMTGEDLKRYLREYLQLKKRSGISPGA